MRILECDLLVLGSGMSGCSAALKAAESGSSVIITTRSPDPRESNTHYAQGGVIYRGDNDSEELFFSDFQKAGGYFCNPSALQQLWEKGPKLVEEILIRKLEIPFTKNSNEKVRLTKEAAHSISRIIHVADYTGKAIEEKFILALKSHPNINLMTRATAIDLLTLAHHSKNRLDIYQPSTCFGAYLYLQESREVVAVMAHETILATGGLGDLYLHTTNPSGSRGDGFAMAYRVGARLMQMEYIQFHPTALYHEENKRFLISEAVRGEGGKLLNSSGNPFMLEYHPLGDLAPRDAVAKSIQTEMLKTKSSCVYLDISHQDPEWIKKRFPVIYNHCYSLGLDMTREPIPVVPAAHYECGGVAVDLSGRTNISRLWAVGEVSCTGAHGSNRLASSSLLEGLVWGTKAGEAASEEARKNPLPFPEIQSWKYETGRAEPDLIHQDWMTIRQTMWNYLGLIRTPKRLERAQNILSELQKEVEQFYHKSELSDDLIGLRHGIQTALLVLHAAQLNRDEAYQTFLAE